MVCDTQNMLSCLLFVLTCVALSAGQNSTFNFVCSRSADLCNGGTCDVSTKDCFCPTDGTAYNYECQDSTVAGNCVEEDVYGPNCDINRVGVYCVAGKMFINVLPHGGTKKFSGLIYLKDKQGVEACTFTDATSQTFEDRAKEYGLSAASDMDGLYLEIGNTNAECGDAVAESIAATATEPAHTLYKRQFYIQYNLLYQASLDQFVTSTCKEVTGASSTEVYVGIGEVSSAGDSSSYEEVNVQSEVGVVSLELLDKNQAAITGPIPLGTELVLKFNLGSGNEYTAIWLSYCKANNSLEKSNPGFKTIDLIDTAGCPEANAAGVFKSLPSKPSVASGQPQVILMSINAFRFTGPSNEVSFQCTVNLCKAGDEANCNPPAGCPGYESTELVLVTTDSTEGTDNTGTTPDLAVSLTSDTKNPLALTEAVTLTCAGSGGTGTLQYSIREQSNNDTATFGSENTLTLSTGTVGTKTYVCEVKDADGNTKTSDPVSLEYVDALTVGISQSPQGDITVNSNVDIACKAAGGTGTYTYVIQRGEVQAAAEATATLTSSTVGTETFKCVVIDTGAGNAVEESPELSVKFVAAVVAVPLAASLSSDTLNPVNINDNVILTCSATGGDGSYTYEIFRGAETVAVSSTSTHTVTLTEAKTETYKCRVTDGTQATVDSGDVSVQSVDTPTAQVHAVPPGPVVKSTNVTLTCKAAGFVAGTLAYSWTRNAVSIEDILPEFTDTSTDAATVSYVCIVTLDTVTATSPPVDVVFTEARRRRSVELRYKRDTEYSDRVSATVSVYDPNAVSEGQVKIVKETDCVHKSDVTVVVIILSIFLFLLLVIATVLGLMVLRSRQKVAGLGHKASEFEHPAHTMAMPRLEINSSGYGSSIGSHGV